MAKVVLALAFFVAFTASVQFEDHQVFSLNDGPSVTAFLQVEDAPNYVEVPVHRVPIATKTIRTLKADKAACQAACNAEASCKGFKHTEGTDACALLSHEEGSTVVADDSAKAPTENADKEKAEADVAKSEVEADTKILDEKKAQFKKDIKGEEEKVQEEKQEADKKSAKS